MTTRTCIAVILAAGEGTRMKSASPKVLHAIAGRSMLGHVLDTVSQAGISDIAVVIGPNREDVAQEIRAQVPQAHIIVQMDRLGTAHAVLAARDVIGTGYDDLLVLFADTPLIEPATLQAMRARLVEGRAVVALGFDTANPHGYGRLLIDGASLDAIREHKDATDDERKVTLCNSGLMALDGKKHWDCWTVSETAMPRKNFI